MRIQSTESADIPRGLRPVQLTQSGGTDQNPYRLALARLRTTFLYVAFFSACVNILMLTGPLFMMQVYDRVLMSASVSTLVGLSIMAFLAYVFLGIYDFLRVRLMSRAAYRLDRDLGDQGFDVWLAAAVRGNPGNRRPLNDLATVRGFLCSPAMLGVFDLPWVPLYLLLIFMLHPWLGLLTLAGAFVVTVLAVLGQILTENGYRRAMSADAAESFLVEQGYRNAEAISALGMTNRFRDRWREMHDDGLASGQDSGDRSEVLSTLSKTFRLLLQSANLGLAAYLVILQEISPGMIIASSIIAGKALAPIDQIIGNWRSVVKAREAHRRLKEQTNHAAVAPQKIALPAPAGYLTLRGVTKRVPGDQAHGIRVPPILSDITFNLEPGDGLGVIGPSASGKSTLARVLSGIWAPDNGEIRIDRSTPDQWEAETLGRHLGYLPQNVELLAGTLRDNICRFDAKASDEDVIAAARLAGVHDMILGLPNGYGFEIGYGSHALSGGQVQRIALARALFGMPRLIVLDEPNSNLDALGDEELAHAILEMRKAGSIVIIMAHRPSALASVNKLLVLQGGRNVAFGDRDEVLGRVTRPAPVPASSVVTVPVSRAREA
jgi:PrtD family type I secretion system ABC transporter